MTDLDCETFDTALMSVSRSIDVEPSALTALLRRFGPAATADLDPVESIAPLLLRPLGLQLEDVRFDGMFCFHGTRVADPTSFLRDGLLPLTDVLDQIWAELYALWADRMSPQEWAALREGVETNRSGTAGGRRWAWMYGVKTGPASDPGPYASLIRDLVLQPAKNHHDYLAIPEIVRDIARCVDDELQARFTTATTGCIVKFRHPLVSKADVAMALLYLLVSVHGRPLDQCAWHPSRKGEPVLSGDVVAVDEVGPPGGLDLRRKILRRHTSLEASLTNQ